MFARRRSAERVEAAGKAVKNNHAAALLTNSSDLTLFRTKVNLPVTCPVQSCVPLVAWAGEAPGCRCGFPLSGLLVFQ